MRRRDFITLLGAAFATWPLTARAQPTDRLRRVGILMGYAESDTVAQARAAAFQRGLRDLGWIEGRNVHFDYRWSGADPQRIRAYAADIVKLAPDAIMSSPAQVTLEVNRLTKSLPIVFVNVPDPVEIGLVASFSHPGGNMTGFANFEHALAGKWPEILKEMAPAADKFGVFYSRDNPAWRGRLRVIEQAAPSLSMQVASIGVSEPAEIGPAFEYLIQEKIKALILLPSIFLSRHRGLIIELAAKYRFPAIYPFRYFVTEGGLLAYGVDLTDQFQRAAGYVDRILKGEKAGDLPVQGPTKFELAINLKTARALGLNVPPMLLVRADEVIE